MLNRSQIFSWPLALALLLALTAGIGSTSLIEDGRKTGAPPCTHSKKKNQERQERQDWGWKVFNLRTDTSEPRPQSGVRSFVMAPVTFGPRDRSCRIGSNGMIECASLHLSP